MLLDRSLAFFAFGTLVLLVAGPLCRGYFPPETVFRNITHLVLPFLLPVATIAFLRKRRSTGVAAMISVAAWAVMLISDWNAWPSESAKYDIRITTLNVTETIESGRTAAETLLDLDSDIAFLQEVSPHHEQAMRPLLADSHPHQIWHPYGLAGKAIVSRFPISHSKELLFAEGARALEVEFEFEGSHIRILNVHVSAWTTLLGRWSPSVIGVEEWVQKQSDERIIIAGDLNSSPRSEFLNRLRQAGFLDSHDEVGGGLGLTFPVYGRYRGLLIPPSVRIDYILTRGNITAVATQTGPDSGPDHLPLTADLVIEEAR